MKHNAIELYGYHVWANDKIFNHLKTLPRDTYDAVIQSVFPSLSKALIHIYRVDVMWLGAISGDSYEHMVTEIQRVLKETKGIGLEDLQQLYHQAAEQFQAFFANNDMDVVKAYPHPQYGTLNASNADIVQHLVNHGTYHRGNITAMLRQQGHPGIPTDYAFYLYEVRD
ncbi:DinB family protein [Paenibacillus sp. UNC451MF]|uniref:DinB family protein n=1 Tax=Paenibacillus sp. UNC451MF TaxID=1449063 RepID=UPI00048C8B83|nr:DinB family protein [Paenibacillus sp. UNC451MF]